MHVEFAEAPSLARVRGSELTRGTVRAWLSSRGQVTKKAWFGQEAEGMERRW